MQGAPSRYVQAVAHAQQRNRKHLRFAALVAILITALLWRTQWLTLRPGLIVLLLGQLGATTILLYRGVTLKKNLREAESGVGFEPSTWFALEAAFTKRIAMFENGLRLIGFVLLAYGFWIATKSLGLALAIGIVYPVTAHFGIGRANMRRTLRDLEMQKRKLEASTVLAPSGIAEQR
jgi:uncharacterized protein YjeT (DUF2065 family)